MQYQLNCFILEATLSGYDVVSDLVLKLCSWRIDPLPRSPPQTTSRAILGSHSPAHRSIPLGPSQVGQSLITIIGRNMNERLNIAASQGPLSLKQSFVRSASQACGGTHNGSLLMHQGCHVDLPAGRLGKPLGRCRVISGKEAATVKFATSSQRENCSQ